MLKASILDLVYFNFVLHDYLVQELHLFDVLSRGLSNFLFLVISIQLFLLGFLLFLPLFILIINLFNNLLFDLWLFFVNLLDHLLLFFIGIVIIYEASEHGFLLLFGLIEHLGSVNHLLLFILFGLLLLLLKLRYLLQRHCVASN